QGFGEHGPEGVEPRLRERLAGALACCRMLRSTENRAISIVVELREVRSPGHAHRHFRRQGEPDGAPQAARPRMDGPERGRTPIGRPQERAHFTPPRKTAIRPY